MLFTVAFALVVVCAFVALIDHFRPPNPAGVQPNPGFWLCMGFLICASLFVFGGKL